MRHQRRLVSWPSGEHALVAVSGCPDVWNFHRPSGNERPLASSSVWPFDDPLPDLGISRNLLTTQVTRNFVCGGRASA